MLALTTSMPTLETTVSPATQASTTTLPTNTTASTTTLPTNTTASTTTLPTNTTDCYGPSGELKGPGDTWVKNSCSECTCTNANKKTCTPVQCNGTLNCQSTETAVYYKPGGSCCGHCEPKTCYFNYRTYQLGEKISDPDNNCVTYTCTDGGLKAKAIACTTRPNCPLGLRQYDSLGCCYTCNPCQLQNVSIFMNYSVIDKNVNKTTYCTGFIVMPRCIGSCPVAYSYNRTKRQYKATSTGCLIASSVTTVATLSANNSLTKFCSYTYQRNTGCTCNGCP
uniref:Integumentary mucin B.1-like n=1 Tax=Geotrypetes seraphini TaxID=260995 RepID=A0A6P8SBB9_GEOSA|nr:integumentary mucin B.1-like [Geotrypetes seraphini]